MMNPIKEMNCLVVATHGHVWHGIATEEGGWLLLKNARIVRSWGTSRGLAQLANKGPLEKTILDEKSEDTRVNLSAVISIIKCNETKWG